MRSEQYLVSVDNGEMWSDHRTYPVLICETESAAETACSEFDKWKKAMIDKFYDDDGLSYEDNSIGDYRKWCVINPCPIVKFRNFTDDMAFCHDVRRFTVSFMPLPTWA